MCAPLIAVAAISAALTLAQQQQQAKTAAEAAKNGGKSARASAINQYGQNNLRITQESEAAAVNKQNVQTRAEQATATARTSAGESGVGGLSVDALLGDFSRQQSNYNLDTNNNLANVTQQIGMGNLGIQTQTQGNINGMFSNLPQPDYAGAAFRIGTAVAGHYDTQP